MWVCVLRGLCVGGLGGVAHREFPHCTSEADAFRLEGEDDSQNQVKWQMQSRPCSDVSEKRFRPKSKAHQK